MLTLARPEMGRQRIRYGTRLPVYFTEQEVADIREHTFADPEFGSFAVLEGSRLRFNLSLDDIEELQGNVAAEANHTENKQLQRRLDRIFEKLQTFLDKYDDQAGG